ncbi:MAG: MBL fold metallo-hydrolase [Candidatus Kerfeldbacteria bacterium]|nr:MBL fold metallo-hydrolase [Candidatus Kerfeldbacteria bacterium]
MTIFPLGGPTFKLQTASGATILLDPHDGKNGLKPPRAQAKLTLLSQTDGRNANAGGTGSLVVQGPGEFEVDGAAIYSVPSATPGKQYFVIESEGMRLGHLGDLDRVLQNGEMDELEGVDVLFLPVGGHGVLDSRKATEVISELEPRLVVPMQFKEKGMKSARDPLTDFCKAFGVKDAEPQDKLRLVKKDLPVEETKVVILQSHG